MLVELNPQSIESMLDWSQSLQSRLNIKAGQGVSDQTLSMLQAIPFVVHDEIQGIYWHFRINTNLAINQIATKGDTHFLVYFVMSIRASETRVNSVYFASSESDFIIHCKKNIDWVIVALFVPRTLFLTICNGTSKVDSTFIKKWLKSKFHVCVQDITPFSIQQVFVQLVRVMKERIKYDSPSGFLLKTHVSFMLVQYIENLQQTIIDQKTQPNYYEQEIERIIKLERQLIRQAILPPLDDLAREVGMSLTKFRHMFKFVYGKPIYEYFLNARMEKAKELLMQGYSVYQVSTMVGFTKANNFSRIFKKYYGFSPSTLRADALVNNS